MYLLHASIQTAAFCTAWHGAVVAQDPKLSAVDQLDPCTDVGHHPVLFWSASSANAILSQDVGTCESLNERLSPFLLMPTGCLAGQGLR